MASVLILGGGIIGVTTAYELAKDGHEVTLIERNEAAALETSFANAGLVAPGHAFAWSSPRAPGILLKSLFRDDQALRFKLRADPRLWAWSWRFLKECTEAGARRNTLNKHRLCLYSQERLHKVRDETRVDYDGQSGGLLYLYRAAETFEGGVAHMTILADDGQEMEVLDRERVAAIDPALAPVKDKIAGAIYCPTDESGDACKFTQGVAEACAGLGVSIAYNTTIRRIEAEGDRIVKVATDKGDYAADAYVLSLGCESPILARQIGVNLPIYPVKGYTATMPIDGRNNPPSIGGVDEDYLVAYVRMGDRLRITATAEFAGYDLSHKPSDFKTMLSAAADLLPEAADYTKPSFRACLRPMTPKGTPIFGQGRHRNLYFNTGQGHMGWTMACGSARITADLVGGREPEIDLAGMRLR